jgi:hypothetical protein
MRKVENMNQERTALEYMQAWIHRLLSRKRKLIGLFVWMFLITGMLQVSCKKSDEVSSPEAILEIQDARNWFTREIVNKEKEMMQLKKWTTAQDSSARLFARMRKLDKAVDWQQAKNFSVNGWNYMIVPVEELESAFLNKQFLRGRALVIYTNPAGIRDLTVVEVLAKPGGSADLIQLVRAGFLNRYQLPKEKRLTGQAELLFYNRSYQYATGSRLVNGNWQDSQYRLRIKVGAASKTRMMASMAQSSSCSSCSTMYLVGFFYDMQSGKVDDYSILTQWEECTDKDQDPSYGDGGSDEEEDEDNCEDKCVEDAAELSSGAYEVAETVSRQETYLDFMRKTVNLKWRTIRGIGWNIYSFEKGVKKINFANPRQWTWESLTHTRMGLEGITIGGSIQIQNDIGTPSFMPGARNILYGGMEVNYDVVYTPICNCPVIRDILQPFRKNYQAGVIWPANE